MSHLVHLSVRPIAHDLDQLEDSSRILQETEATCCIEKPSRLVVLGKEKFDLFIHA